MYFYRCRSCNQDLKLLHLDCLKCGVTNGIFQKTTALDSPKVKCVECDSTLAHKLLPDTCNKNHRFTLGWASKTEWLQPDLNPTNISPNDVWISGDFVGCFQEISQLVSLEYGYQDQRNYAIPNVQQARLSNILIISAPPLRLQDREIPPLRFPSVTPVLVHIFNMDQEKSDLYSVTLADFRLHDWHELTIGEESKFLGKQVFGVFAGRAYGVLRQDPKLDLKRIETSIPLYRTTKAIDKTIDYSKQVISDLFNEDDQHDNLQEILPTNNGSPTVGAFPSCLSCSLWLQGVFAGMVCIFCNWKHALVFLSVAILACSLSKVSKKRGWIPSKSLRIFIFVLLAMLSLIGILLEAYSLGFSQDCALATDGSVYLIATAYLLTALLDYCKLRFLMLSIWFTSTLLWCSTNNLECNPQHDIRRIDLLVHEIKINIEKIINPDIDSIIVNEITDDPNNPDKNRKIPIDEIIKRPELLDICGNSIYFSDAALFPVNQYEIEPRAELELRKLAAVVQRIPDRTIIITGHSDIKGDETDQGYMHNLDLSYNRAQKVAEWLSTNAGVESSKIEVRGAGTSIPITTEENSRHLNRRVEVQLECLKHIKK